MFKLKLVSALFGVLLGAQALAANAEDLAPDDLANIQTIIAEQIKAFKRDDAARAFSYAAPVVRERFGDESQFIAMVKRHYPAIYRPSFYFFGEAKGDTSQTVQRVELTGPRGKSWSALYHVVKQDDGIWKIEQVVMIAADGQET